MTNQEQYERVWSKAEDYDRLKEQVLTSEKVYEAHIKRLEAENAELKKFVEVAVKDIGYMREGKNCELCVIPRNSDIERCEPNTYNGDCGFKWRYEEWAKKLIGGMQNG